MKLQQAVILDIGNAIFADELRLVLVEIESPVEPGLVSEKRIESRFILELAVELFHV